jgi:fatty-acyl-CoA synthase
MLSYARGPEVPLLESPIYEIFAATAERSPDRPALIVCHQNVRLTWGELRGRVEAVARGLAGLGLRPGDRVGVWASNCLEWVLLQFACAQAQMVLVNINPAYRSHELRYVLARSGMRALFLWESDDRADYRAILDEAREGQSLALVHVVYFGQDSWSRMLETPGTLPAAPADPHDVANMQYTSGTTGQPKGVLLTHHNLVNNGMAFAAGLCVTEQDRICVPVPLYHCFGCVIGSIVWIVSGCAMVIPAARFDALATLQAVASERATALYGVPAMFIAELEHPDFGRFDLTSLRTGVMAGAPCPIEVMKRVMTDMHCPGITIAYGQTESSPVVTMSHIDDAIENRVCTVGRPLPNTEIQIVSPTGAPVPIGEPGEVCARGYMVMRGYDQDPEATSRAIDSEGWLHTGDLGVMRADGYIKITGRAKDMIIRGGENISPREIEEFLHTHRKIAEVQVVGVPDLRLGEAVAVWVRLRTGESATEDEIREFCRGRIAHFKIPHYVRFVDAFPMTVSGKVQKFRMREQEIRARGLEGAADVRTA